ncbi:MAG: hypothetical protein HY543_08085 [Deltaproteobacteria bacterium]|nr:hypothetical protein [Deltaproteobacteria bacterium]
MLKLFFNKESPVVYALEAIGLFLLAWFLARGEWRAWAWPRLLAGGSAVGCYLFLRWCVLWRWYPRASPGGKYLGIALQFKKALVPASYLLALFGILLHVHAPTLLLYAIVFLLIVIAHVNGILLYFHARDRDATPVNYFSRSEAHAGSAPAIDAADVAPLRRAIG